jgi:hypothetical protein
MASGINSTFRQVGIATGIALLGTLFSSQLRDFVAAHGSALGGRGPQIAAAIQSGRIGPVLQHLPPAARPAVEQVTRAAFASGLNSIMLVAAIIALAGGVVAALQRALRGDPFHVLTGDLADPVKVCVVVQDNRAIELGGRRDDQVRQPEVAVLAADGHLAVHLKRPVHRLRRDVDPTLGVEGAPERLVALGICGVVQVLERRHLARGQTPLRQQRREAIADDLMATLEDVHRCVGQVDGGGHHATG